MRTKTDYLTELKRNLKRILPKEEAMNAYHYFEEFIEEANLADYKAIKEKLGTPREVSYNAIIDYQELQLQTENNLQKIKWLLPLTLLLSAPIGLPLIMLAVILMLVAFMMLGIAAGMLYLLVALGWIIGGMFLVASVFTVFYHVFTAIFHLGIALMVLSLSWMVTPPLIRASKKIAVSGYTFLLNKMRPKNKGEFSYVE